MPKPAVEEVLDDLEPDAALATEIKDLDERNAQQLEYFGGDPDDAEDTSAMDRGDTILPEEDENAEKEEDEDAEAEDSESGEEEADGEADADDDGADSEEDADSDDQGDAESGDDDDDAEGEASDSESSVDAQTNNRGIPLSRFNEVNERMKRAEARINELESTDQAVAEAEVEAFDFDAAEEEYMDLLLDGKTKEAGAKRRDIRAAEKADISATAVATSTQTADNNAQRRELNSLTSQAADLYPQFNENSADYDQNIADKTITFMRGYVASGVPAADAFVAALADTIDMFGLDDSATPEPEPKPEVKKGKPIKKVKEKVEVAKKQVAAVALGGRASDEHGATNIDVTKMTDAEMDALPPATLARLRGDDFEG